MKRKRHHGEEPENHERWLISYSDFMTTLLALFVVLYSVSSVNMGKYRVLSETLMSVFRHIPTSTSPIRLSTRTDVKSPIKPVKISPQRVSISQSPSTLSGETSLRPIAIDIEKALAPMIRKGEVTVTRNSLGVVIHIKSDLLFPSGSNLLNTSALPVLSRLGLELQTLHNPIQIQGYTDNLPIHNSKFANNWELSTSRAVTILQLFQVLGVSPRRMVAAGFGQYHPIASNKTPAGRAKNRRVDIVILARSWQNRPDEPLAPHGAISDTR